MIEIVLSQANAGVMTDPNRPGLKFLIFQTQQGIQVTVPLTEEGARAIAAQLGSGLIIASSMPIPPAPKAQ